MVMLRAIGVSGLLLCVLCCNGNAFKEEDSDNGDTGSDTATDIDTRLGIGRACVTSADCVTNIECSRVDNTCQYPGSPGTYPRGAECLDNLLCSIGLVCASDGTCANPGEAGTGQIDDSCLEGSDCGRNFVCKNNRCFGYQTVYWKGAQCEAASEEGDFVAYFDVNRQSGEFYRLPYPNDGAIINGRIELTTHTNPGVLNDALGNLTGAYLTYIGNEMKGFGTQSGVYFRMSHKPDWDSIETDETAYIVNIDPASAEYGKMHSIGYAGNTAAQMYICSNWLALRPREGRPLSPGTTYAAVLTQGVKDREGNSLNQEPQFSQMLSGVAPPPGRTLVAWNAYAPLRNWVGTQGIDSKKIAVATVFTTQRFTVLPRLRLQVRNEALPTLLGNALVIHSTGNAYTHYTGTVSVPFYQNGVRPFFDTGGGFQFDANGFPIRVSNDNVPFALTVPTGEPPAAGWPIFLYAHGTDGSESSFIDNGIAERMAQSGVAVISMLQVQHGIRRGIPAGMETEETQPGMLFYNLRNPYAAIGNNFQAAVDYFQLVRLVENFAAVTHTEIPFDIRKVYYFGHSQGTQGQYLAAVHEPLIKGIVLSGAGGYLTESMLHKKQPFDMKVIMQYLLMDPYVDKSHPVLSLIQAAMEQVDPVNHSPAAFKNQWPGMTYPARDLFMAYGIGDSYAPESTQYALARSLVLNMDVVDKDHEVSGLSNIDKYPYTGNRTVDGTLITTVGMQYRPDGDYDAHFVLFRNSDAINQLAHFVETMIDDDTLAEIITP